MLPNNYDPLIDPVYMSPYMLQFFKQRLQTIHRALILKTNDSGIAIIEQINKHSDSVEQQVVEPSIFTDCLIQEHDYFSLTEIEQAIKRIHNNSYGYCLKTNQPIGVKRLLSIPTAKYCIEIQKLQESL